MTRYMLRSQNAQASELWWYLAALCVLEAAVLSEAIIHAGKDISHQLVVASKGSRYNVPVHDDVPYRSCWQPQTFQQAPVCHLLPVHDWMAGFAL